MDTQDNNDFHTLQWVGDVDGYLELLDQTGLPSECIYIACRDVESVWEGIKMLRVRGAPAIGVAAAYGVSLGVQSVKDASSGLFANRLNEVCDFLATSRPTAVNLFWAIERMRKVGLLLLKMSSPPQVLKGLLEEARQIEREDCQSCHDIGLHGRELLHDGDGVLTHCNAGALATAGSGTALAVILAAHEQGKRLHVFADETRPLLQGARLTTWELMRRGVKVTLICDSMAAQVMREGRVQVVVTGADRIAGNGDVANKIGTYSVALAADYHNIPFYVAAPISTFDLGLKSGNDMPIEQRSWSEVTLCGKTQVAPEGVDVYNPAFDVTPVNLVHAISCERGIIAPVNRERIMDMVK